MGGKESIDKIWPIKGVEAVSRTFEQPTKEWWDEMKKNQAKIDEQINRERHGSR